MKRNLRISRFARFILGGRTFSPLCPRRLGFQPDKSGLKARPPRKISGYLLPLIGIALLSNIILTTEGSGRIIRVPGDFDQIHVAVEFAGRGDTVLVWPGTYEEAVRIRSLDFVVGSLLLTTGDPRYIDETIIDGSGIGTPVVRADGGDAGSPLFRGFTLTGGLTDYGGGIICRDSTRPVFEDLKIIGNESQYMGGGAYCYRGSTATFRRVIFEDNTSNAGGGVAEYQGQTIFEYCTILGNHAESGGGLYSYFSSPILTNCSIGLNTPNNLSFIYSHPELLRVSIDNGEIATEAVFVHGGKGRAETTFDRVTFYSSRNEDAILIRIIGANGEFVLPRFNLYNSIVRGRSNRLISMGDGALEVTATIENCNIQSGRNSIRMNGRVSLLWGEHNIDSDPQFVDVDASDFHLEADSPCIDAGADWSDPDPDNTRADLGGIPFGGFPASIQGRVTDLRFNEPVHGAEVVLSDQNAEILRSNTNVNGIWSGVALLPSISWQEVEVLVRAEGSRNSHGSVFLALGGLAQFSTGVEISPFQLSRDDFTIELDPGSRSISQLIMESESDLPINWSMSLEESDSAPAPGWDYNSFMSISPNSDELVGGRSEIFRLTISTVDAFGDTLLEAGEYLAQARLAVEDYFADIILPIRLTVNDLSVDELTLPFDFDVRLITYPQPFNSMLTLEYRQTKPGRTNISLMDVRGRVIREVGLGIRQPGVYRETLGSEDLTAGVYLLRVDGPGGRMVRKVICVK